ncbi:MAG: hypothetical protein ACI88A_002224 [Paraglaciecola sp.]|jgi:hypothetical protein
MTIHSDPFISHNDEARLIFTTNINRAMRIK